jgi:HEPN domain-containing protein
MTKWDEDLTFKVNLSMSDKDKILYLERDLELARQALLILKTIKAKVSDIELDYIYDSISNTESFIVQIKSHIKDIIGSRYVEKGFHDDEDKPF